MIWIVEVPAEGRPTAWTASDKLDAARQIQARAKRKWNVKGHMSNDLDTMLDYLKGKLEQLEDVYVWECDWPGDVIKNHRIPARVKTALLGAMIKRAA
jgi:hypothetical protein